MAPGLPRAWQTKRGSRSDSRRSSAEPSAFIATPWLHRKSEQQTMTPLSRKAAWIWTSKYRPPDRWRRPHNPPVTMPVGLSIEARARCADAYDAEYSRAFTNVRTATRSLDLPLAIGDPISSQLLLLPTPPPAPVRETHPNVEMKRQGSRPSQLNAWASDRS